MDVFELNCPSKRSEQVMRLDQYVRTMVGGHDNRKVSFLFMIRIGYLNESISIKFFLLKMFVILI